MTGDTNTIASVVIPERNEEDHIARTLDALTADSPRHLLEIIVVCNGCTDRTGDVARAVARQRPDVRVVEIATASKVAALREGDREIGRASCRERGGSREGREARTVERRE